MQDWHGVYYVKKVLGPNTYLVQKPGCRKTKVPTDRLKLFNEYLHLNDPNVKITPEEEEDEPCFRSPPSLCRTWRESGRTEKQRLVTWAVLKAKQARWFLRLW